MMKMMGPLAFYIGLLVSLIAAVWVTPTGWLYVALAILGVIVGLANVTAKETGPFLFASVAFIVSALGITTLLTATIPATLLAYPQLVQLAANITVFVGAGAMLIALKAIYGIAKSG